MKDKTLTLASVRRLLKKGKDDSGNPIPGAAYRTVTKTTAATLRSNPDHGPYTLTTDQPNALGQTGTLEELLPFILSGRYMVATEDNVRVRDRKRDALIKRINRVLKPKGQKLVVTRKGSVLTLKGGSYVARDSQTKYLVLQKFTDGSNDLVACGSDLQHLATTLGVLTEVQVRAAA
jgi:hypothetical protein